MSVFVKAHKVVEHVAMLSSGISVMREFNLSTDDLCSIDGYINVIYSLDTLIRCEKCNNIIHIYWPYGICRNARVCANVQHAHRPYLRPFSLPKHDSLAMSLAGCTIDAFIAASCKCSHPSCPSPPSHIRLYPTAREWGQ